MIWFLPQTIRTTVFLSNSIFFCPASTLWPTVPATQYPGMTTWNETLLQLLPFSYISSSRNIPIPWRFLFLIHTMLLSFEAHFLKICRESPACNIPGVAKTTFKINNQEMLSNVCPVLWLQFSSKSNICSCLSRLTFELLVT